MCLHTLWVTYLACRGKSLLQEWVCVICIVMLSTAAGASPAWHKLRWQKVDTSRAVPVRQGTGRGCQVGLARKVMLRAKLDVFQDDFHETPKYRVLQNTLVKP